MASTLYWLNKDLRLTDNLAFDWALQNSKRLTCVYCIEPDWFKAKYYQTASMGNHRYQFLVESLTELAASLEKLGQKLIVVQGCAAEVIAKLLQTYQFDFLITNRDPGIDEQKLSQQIQQKSPADVQFIQFDNSTLFCESELNFNLSELPASFSKARKYFEQLTIRAELDTPKTLPAPLTVNIRSELSQLNAKLKSFTHSNVSDFERATGGESKAQQHLAHYFSDDKALNYKNVRNALSGWQNSTKFSFWLAHGCISPVQIYQKLKQFEQAKFANESTYWIYFELLWREYFYWYGYRYQHALFQFKGISNKNPSLSFYPARFKQWQTGTTPYPLVNACMQELAATGYLSNRGRQIAASCLVNELQVDWRYGAAWFEHCLIDYDVAVNWGNWQYIAGVGADPRGGRHFNIEKQTEMYDPKQTYINQWQAKSYPLNETDMVDWPQNLTQAADS